MNPLRKEIQAVTAAITAPHDSPEAAAKAAIEALDQARTERVTYFAVLRFGTKESGWFSGFGPYSTANQATKALEKHPAVGMARGMAVVPTLTEEGYAALLESVDTPAKDHGQWTEVRKDAQAFKAGWNGKKAASTREQYLS